MGIDVMGDLISFGMSILVGFLIGILFDLYRSFRYFSKPKKALSHIEDLFFWVIIILVFFMLLVETTDGTLRGFVFIGCFCGSVLYLLLLSKFFLNIFIIIFKLILEVFSEIIRLMSYPFKGIFNNSKKRISKIILIPKIFFKEMGRYSKIISKKK